jgi:hypothetical protein
LFSGRLFADYLPPSFQQRLEEQLTRIGQDVSNAIMARHIKDLSQFKLTMIRPGVGVVNNQVIPAYWLFYHLEIRHSQAGGGAGAEGTIVLELDPSIGVDGLFSVATRFWVFDMRFKDWGAGAAFDGEGQVRNVVQKELPATLNGAATEISRTLAEQLKGAKIPGAAEAQINWLTADEAVKHLIVQKAMDEKNPSDVTIPDQGGGRPHFDGAVRQPPATELNDGALIVMFIGGFDANVAFTRGNHDINVLLGDEPKHPGCMYRIMYLPQGYQYANLKTLHDERGDWNDRLGSVVILPGPRWAGQKLALYNDANYKGTKVLLGPGFYSLNIKYGGMQQNGVFKQASSVSVEN